jgi:ankyrin repeat protein
MDMRAALDQSKVKAAKKRGDTDLHIAAAKGDSTAVMTLIGEGAALNAVNDNGHTPLMLAIRQEQTDTAKVLVARGAKADLADEKGDTALHHAIRAGQLDVVRAILDKGIPPNGSNKTKDTPLILATKFDYPEIALLLIGKGAQVAVTDDHGLAPLHYAANWSANWRRVGVVQELLARGVPPDVKAPKGQTALMTAAYLGDLQIVNLLLEKGAKVNERDDQGQTSLHLAAQNGHAKVVMVLLGGRADGNAATTAGRTAALLAAQNDHGDVLKDLVRAGARFVPLAETEEDIYASALVAQAIAEEAVKQKDLPRAREHQKLASGWFEKAAVAYEDSANSADNKILAKKILRGVGVVLVVATAILVGMAQQEQANFQAKQMAQMQALHDANASGTGTQGYFSLVRQYENAYRNIPQGGTPRYEFQPTLHTQPFAVDEKPDLEKLRDLYRKVAEQGRQAAKQSAMRMKCLEPPTQEVERTTCLTSLSTTSDPPIKGGGDEAPVR